MLIVTGTICVLPSDLTEFTADLQSLAVATRRRDGNLSYDAGILDTTTGKVLVVERWRDQAALSNHLAAADTLAFIDRWQRRMVGDVQKFDATNGRPLNAG